MAGQVCYEDVEVGMEIPTLTKHPTLQQLVMYAGATDDYDQNHYDNEFAQKNLLPGIILHGLLKAGFVGQLLTDWIGVWGVVRKLDVSYRGMDKPEMPLLMKGKVIGKREVDGQGYVELEVWTENLQGEKTTPGTATVTLPRREKPGAP